MTSSLPRLLCLLLLLHLLEALPVKESDKKIQTKEEKKIESELDDLGLEYGRYLQQVVEALEQDKDFAKKLENVSQEEIKSGAIARELNLVDHGVRNKLDELKRIEMDRLRRLARKENDRDGERQWRSIATKIDADHLDHGNPHSFEAEDLQKLILQATKDLEELDAKRKEDFKTYEMEKELRFREELVNMTDSEREKVIKEHEKKIEHPKIHHPGSKKQLEQVWEEKDHLPRQEFDPKIFFQLHDINGDQHLDPEEVEAILSVEVRKLYPEGHSDPNEMQEEYHRMREHIYKEADVNKDGLISKKEFLEFTRRMEFQQDEGWKGLDEEKVYSEEELKHFQRERAEHPQEVLQRQQYQAYQQYHHQGGPGGHGGQFQQFQQHPGQYPGQGGHPQQGQYGQYYEPVQQYIPPPQQMTAEEWHHLQQQYYQQQLHQQPNPMLHQGGGQGGEGHPQQFQQIPPQQHQQGQQFQGIPQGVPQQHIPPQQQQPQQQPQPGQHAQIQQQHAQNQQHVQNVQNAQQGGGGGEHVQGQGGARF